MATIKSINFTSNVSIYSYVYTFEEKFSPERARQWMNGNQRHGFYLCGIYLFLVFYIRFYIRNQPPYNLRAVMLFWYGTLSAFNALGALRTIPELYYMLAKYSLYNSVCEPVILEPTKVTEFWNWLFVLSKIIELGDSIYGSLRKNTFRFIHLYHHVYVLLYSWTSYTEHTSYERWFKPINYAIHASIYSYFFIRTIGFSIPKFIAIIITLAQILQFVIGSTIISLAWYYRLNQQPCQVSNTGIILGECMCFSFLILFGRIYFSPLMNKSSSVSVVNKNR